MRPIEVKGYKHSTMKDYLRLAFVNKLKINNLVKIYRSCFQTKHNLDPLKVHLHFWLYM